MAWTIEYGPAALKALKKLDKRTSGRILDFMRDRVARSDRPRDIGRALSGSLSGHWRYRIGDYRVICNIRDERLVVLVLDVGDRKEVYR